MPIPPLPPLRIRETDGAPNVIPVFEIVLSNNTLTDLGAGVVGIGAGGAAGASTAETYIVIANTDSLAFERALTAGLGITLADSGAGAGVYVQAATPFLVSSNRTLTAVYPVLSGGNLGADRSFHVDTAFLLNSGAFPILAGSGGTGRTTLTLNNLVIGSATAPVKLLSIGSANLLLGVTSAGTVEHEYKQLVAGANITVAYNGTAVTLSATTGSGATQTVRFPLGLLTVQVASANAYWANSQGTNVDFGHVRFVDGGEGVATYWGHVPYNVNATEAWGIILGHKVASGNGGNVLLSTHGLSLGQADTMDVAMTLLSSAAALATVTAGILNLTAVSGGTFDAVEGLSGGDLLFVRVTRHGGNAGDTLSASWDLFSVNLQCDVNV